MPAMWTYNVRHRRRVVVDDRPLAASIGLRLRAARRRAGLTQQALAGERYTKAYISALETGVAKPSMAALNYLSGRLGMPASAFIDDTETAWTRLDADLRLAQGDFVAALEGYTRPAGRRDPSAADRAAMLAGLAEALVRLDRGAEAIKLAAEAVSIFEDLGRPAERINAQYWLASGHHAADNHDEARALMREILDELGPTRRRIDSQLRVRALIALGVVEMGAGRTDAAIAYLREADGLAGELDTRRRATYLYAIAHGYRRAGDHEAAIRAGTQSLALFRSAEAGIESAGIANHLALAYLEAGSRDQAARAGPPRPRHRGARPRDERLLAHIADTQARIELAAGEPVAAAARSPTRRSSSSRRRPRTGPALLDAMVTKARTSSRHDRATDASDAPRRGGRPRPHRRTGLRAAKDVLSAWADALAHSGDHARAYEIMREAAPARSLRAAPGAARHGSGRRRHGASTGLGHHDDG